jgi:hypothetical protein
MSSAWETLTDLLCTPAEFGCLQHPLVLQVQLCDLRPRFLFKGRVGRGHRYIARNGKVLVACDQALGALASQFVKVRFQVWHRAILPGDHLQPYGILVCIKHLPDGATDPFYWSCLAKRAPADFALDVGGSLFLQFQRIEARADRAALLSEERVAVASDLKTSTST